MGYPDYVVMFRGRRACPCQAKWIPVVEREAIRRGIIRYNLDIAQLIGGAAASAGTHTRGGAADFWQTSRAFIALCREAGADATWHRPYNWDGRGGGAHAHSVLTGCPHNGPARYQIGEVRAGRNGLANHGADTGPRPLSGRTWEQGIAWLKSLGGGTVPTPSGPTRFDIAQWNVASPKPGWFPVAWKDRQAAIGRTLAGLDCSIVTCNETHFSYQTADILRALGNHYRHVSSPIGNDLFYDDTKYDQTRDFKEYPLGAQNRYAGVLHLTRTQTGQPLTVVSTHFPYNSTSLRSVAARNLVALLADVDGPIVLTGDFNNQSFVSGTPHYYLRRAGYEFMREQAQVVNGSKPEYPKKGQWLSDIATDRDRPGKAARITSGVLTLTSSKLSDHRPLKARVEIR